jgi:hypothetical protein
MEPGHPGWGSLKVTALRTLQSAESVKKKKKKRKKKASSF